MPLRRSFTPAVCVLATAVLSACHDPDPARPWLGAVSEVTSPAGPGSRYPHLAAAADGVVMSWLEPADGDGFALRQATWRPQAWSPATTVASGADWFVNWADFPSVVPLTPGTWAAHWLVRKPGSVYAYDVHTALSTDAGATWSASFSPHDDGTPTEHGFVSLFAADGRPTAAWLDGRRTSGGDDHDAADAGAMTLRSGPIDGRARDEPGGSEIDPRTCDCCQTDSATTEEGTVLVYRDRSADEVRDIALVRLHGGRWSKPTPVHADGWRVDACPVNGPAVAALGRTVVVAWFTAPDVPRVRIAFSDDAGRSFAPPQEVASGGVTGRVDVVLLEDGRAVVSWLQGGEAGAAIRAQPFRRDGAAGAEITVAASSVQRSSGFPQMVRAGDGLLFAWTDSTAPQQVRTAFARLQ
jgi:hypothetical protein